MDKEIQNTLKELYYFHKEDFLAFIGEEMNTREVMNELVDKNYKEYIKSIIGIEHNINDEEILYNTIDFFLDKDYVPLLSDNLNDFVYDEIYKKKEELLEGLKKAIIDYNNREFQTDYEDDDFFELYPNPEEVDLAYTTTPDGEHTIKFSIDLIGDEWGQYVDDEVVVKQSFAFDEDMDIFDGYKDMIERVSNSSFNNLVRVDDVYLQNSIGLAIDDEGNFYDPKELNKDDDLEI